MKKTLIAVSMVFIPFVVNAQWIAKVDDDLFSGGKKATLVATIDASGEQAIVFDCTKDSLSFSYIEKGEELGKTNIPMKILAKIDSGDVINFNAKSGQRNSDYSAAESTDTDAITKLLAQSAKAKSKLLVGLSVPEIDFKQSFTVSLAGSKSAVNQFAKACEIKLD